MECFHYGISTSASDTDMGALFIKWITLGDAFRSASDSSKSLMAEKIMTSKKCLKGLVT